MSEEDGERGAGRDARRVEAPSVEAGGAGATSTDRISSARDSCLPTGVVEREPPIRRSGWKKPERDIRADGVVRPR